MNSQNILKPIISFFLFVFAQAIFGQQMVWGSYAFCFFYVAYLLDLPFELGRVPLLIIGFGLGLAVDIAYNTIGIHAASCVLMAYLRDPIKGWIRPGGGYEPGMEPSIQSMGFQWVFSYASLLVLAHHLLFFLLEASNWELWPSTLLKVLASSIFTLVIILILKSFKIKRKRR